MNDILTLLKPRISSIRNSGFSKRSRGRAMKFLLIGTIGLVFWAGLFAISLRVLSYFKGIEDIGDILALKLLSMILITSFVLLIFSSILTSLSKLYLSRDLLLVHSLPVSSHKIFPSDLEVHHHLYQGLLEQVFVLSIHIGSSKRLQS